MRRKFFQITETASSFDSLAEQTNRRERFGPLVLRRERWGGLVLDERHDRIWGFATPEFEHMLARFRGKPTPPIPITTNTFLEDFLAIYSPEATESPNPYRWGGPHFIGKQPPQRGFELSAPISLSWSITNQCQSTCGYCCTNSHAKAHSGLSIKDTLRAIDLFAKWGVLRLIIGGGEPLIRTDLLEILDQSLASGLRPTLATNALDLTKMDLDRIGKMVMLFQISLDTLDELTYTRLRGTRGGVALVMCAIRELHARSLPIRVVTVLTKENQDDLEAIGHFLIEEGVRQWAVFLVQPSGRARRGFERFEPQYLTDIYQRLATLEASTPELSISFWGDMEDDQIAIYVDSKGHLQQFSYATGVGRELARLSQANIVDIEQSWHELPSQSKWSTLINFTRTERRISSREWPPS